MWNYRIIKHNEKNYGLHEVIYNDNNEISAYTEQPQESAETPFELIQHLGIMLTDGIKSLDNIIDKNNIEFAPLYDEEEEDFDEFEQLRAP